MKVNMLVAQCLLVLGVFMLSGCEGAGQEALSDFDKFQMCLEKHPSGEESILRGRREACLQKYEQLSEGFSGRNVSAGIYGKSGLQVAYTNPYEFVITSIEVDIRTPYSPSGISCDEDLSQCGHFYASGRVWILPKKRGDTVIHYPTTLAMTGMEEEPLWSFSIQSIRYLRFKAQ